jgi:hypothetical protein
MIAIYHTYTCHSDVKCMYVPLHLHCLSLSSAQRMDVCSAGALHQHESLRCTLLLRVFFPLTQAVKEAVINERCTRHYTLMPSGGCFFADNFRTASRRNWIFIDFILFLIRRAASFFLVPSIYKYTNFSREKDERS